MAEFGDSGTCPSNPGMVGRVVLRPVLTDRGFRHRQGRGRMWGSYAMQRAGAISEVASTDPITPYESFDVTAARPRRVSVIIPTKNEARNIGWVLDRLPSIVDEVVLIDANSIDGTVEVARAHRPDIVVVSDHARGKGAAVRAGVYAATGDDIVMLDADGSMDPSEIHRFIGRLREGYDLVKGSRFLRDEASGTADISTLRSAGNRGLLAVTNFLYGTSNTDLCYGYAAFRRAAFVGLGLTGDGFEIEAQLFLRSERTGLKVVEVASFEAPRRTGNSNLNTFRDGWRVLMTILSERRRPVPAPAPAIADVIPYPGPAVKPRLSRQTSAHAVVRMGDGYRDP